MTKELTMMLKSAFLIAALSAQPGTAQEEAEKPSAVQLGPVRTGEDLVAPTGQVAGPNPQVRALRPLPPKPAPRELPAQERSSSPSR